MSIASRIEAIEQHLTDDYNVLEVAGADLTNVDKNILNLKTTWQERLLYFMNNGTDVVWNNWDKVTGEGTSISLNNTLEGKMKIVLKGNTSQEGTPTPETPQDIHVVSGDNSIVVCGKNLFNDIRTDSATLRGVSWTPVEQGIKLSGTFDKQYNLDLWITASNSSSYSNNMVLLKANTKYSFSVFIESGSMTNTSISVWGSSRTASDKTFDWNYKRFGDYSNGKWATTYTTGNEDIYLGGIRFAINRNDTITFNDAIIKVQVEEGEATTYEPYTGESYPVSLGDIELCKIGDYQDSIVKDNGKWYLNKQIGKYTITDSDISLISSYWYNTYGQYGAGILKSNLGLPETSTNRQSLCNMSKKIDGQSYINNNTYIFNANANYVFFFSSDFDTKEHANGKLVGANVYFNLDTPTYTEIEDTTLINQLETIKKSYEGQTNITQTNTDLPFIINATALKEMS